MALCTLYKTRQAEKAGADIATALAPLTLNEAKLIAVDKRIFIKHFENPSGPNRGSGLWSSAGQCGSKC